MGKPSAVEAVVDAEPLKEWEDCWAASGTVINRKAQRKDRVPSYAEQVSLFVRDVDARLSEQGFRLISNSEGFIEWSQPSNAVADDFVDLVRVPDRRGRIIGFNVLVGVHSAYVRDIDNAVRMWECSHPRAMFPATGPREEPDRLVQVYVSWLMLDCMVKKYAEYIRMSSRQIA